MKKNLRSMQFFVWRYPRKYHCSYELVRTRALAIMLEYRSIRENVFQENSGHMKTRPLMLLESCNGLTGSLHCVPERAFRSRSGPCDAYRPKLGQFEPLLAFLTRNQAQQMTKGKKRFGLFKEWSLRHLITFRYLRSFSQLSYCAARPIST